ncbi:MAG: glycosyltransferase family 25 protein [Hyphomonadaceae bacterium]
MEKEQSFQVFVISLERAVERREYMRNLVAQLGFTATIISAVDGKNLRPEQRARYNSERARRIYGCEMSDNEIACYLSHLSIYSKMLEQRIDTALILEDDISCVADLKPIVEDVLKLPKTSWQVVRLQSTRTNVQNPTNARRRGEPVAQVGEREIFRIQTSILGGCAYLIRLGAAASMLARSEHMDMPIDQTLDRYWENGIIPYVLRPMPVWHEDLFESEIGQRGRALQQQPTKKVVTRRRIQRFVDSLNKRIFWLAFRVPSLGSVLSRLGIPSARMAMVALWGGQVFREI